MENYCNSIWPLIYDRFNQGRHQQELAFYSRELASCAGPVLEVACGTGMIFLPLLKQGLDIYGIDLSGQMLQQLFAKAEAERLADVRRRVSRQNMIDFRIAAEFEAAFIPARSFLHLPTQEDQLACLRNVHRHLRDGGKLMMNFFTPSLPAILSRTDPNPVFTAFGQYPHPDGSGVISVSMRQTNDLSEQVQRITWRFEYAGHVHESPMLVRWIYKTEFELLAKLSGFRVRHLYSGFDGSPYNGEGEMVWVLEKAPNNSAHGRLLS
jgi:SAM-dependent methyltransferase